VSDRPDSGSSQPLARHRERPELHEPEDRGPVEALDDREALEQAASSDRGTGSPISESSIRASAGRHRGGDDGLIAGTVWIALQPVPSTATRLPGQLDVVSPLGCVNAGPANVQPGIGGVFGTDSCRTQ